MGLWTDFERISDDVKISVIFTPKRDQPESVYAIVGKNAEGLTGDQVEVSGNFNVLKAETTLNVHFIPPSASMLMPSGKAAVESVEIGHTVLRDWGSQPLRYYIDYTLNTTIYVKDQNGDPIEADGELILELYERKPTDDGSSKTEIGVLLDRWEKNISEKSVVGESGGHEFRLQYSNMSRLEYPYSRPYGVEYGILQVTLVTSDGKMFYAVNNDVSLEVWSEKVKEAVGC
ncbi:MAG: hypothetical protein GKB99_01815 [Methanocellales archaeon]|nr:hypothetical protein [Methanocellales archaeon]